MSKITTSLSLSRELLDKIDVDRRLISRSAYVEFLLKKLFTGEVSNEK